MEGGGGGRSEGKIDARLARAHLVHKYAHAHNWKIFVPDQNVYFITKDIKTHRTQCQLQQSSPGCQSGLE